ncbi:hypothetical protein IJJ97_05130, partial [bacterium]|nr:hypothetical protein [bacterium]
ELDTHVKSIVSSPISNSVARPSDLQNDIVDLTIDRIDDKIQFNLTVLRIKDAERHFQIGTRNLINATADTRKYIENLSWISTPSNT